MSGPIKVVSGFQITVITSIQLKITLSRPVQVPRITVSEPDIVHRQPVRLRVGSTDRQADSHLDVRSLAQSSCDKGPVSGSVSCLGQGSLTGKCVK